MSNKNDENLIIDCFAGGGGASVGIEMALGRSVDIAINHDPAAIRMHKTNHPGTKHLTEDIFAVDLQKYVKGRHVSLLWGSPDCRHFSVAAGRAIKSPIVRMLPWAVHKHASILLPDVIIMENVAEIQNWGPLDETGYPIKERQGEEYKKFVAAMCDLGYDFDSRELVAADYGAPTTRKRWYAIFRRDGKPIVWPTPTHSKDGSTGKKWLECGDLIDWSDLGKSIFDRKRILAASTRNRIKNGIQKYIVDCPNPYMVTDKRAFDYLEKYRKSHGEMSEKDCLVSSFISKFYKTGIGQSCTEPLHTITTSAGHFGLVSAFLVKYYGTGGGQKLSDPLGTITTKDRFGLVNVVVEINGEKYVVKDVFLRMLKPEELKLMQGFPKDYIIDHDSWWKTTPVAEQVKRIGNSVVPMMAEALVNANCGYLKVGERVPNVLMREDELGQLVFA